jgi:hypothetical protein
MMLDVGSKGEEVHLVCAGCYIQFDTRLYPILNKSDAECMFRSG